MAISCTSDPAQAVAGIAVASTDKVPPVTVTSTWSEPIQAVVASVTVKVNKAEAVRLTVVGF